VSLFQNKRRLSITRVADRVSSAALRGDYCIQGKERAALVPKEDLLYVQANCLLYALWSFASLADSNRHIAVGLFHLPAPFVGACEAVCSHF
jgi:hypothetical protein